MDTWREDGLADVILQTKHLIGQCCMSNSLIFTREHLFRPYI